jgi:hypothetical protein
VNLNGRLALIDAGFAVLLAALVLILSPGVAVAGMIALFAVVVCAISFAIDRLRGRSGRRAQRVRTVKKSGP